MFKKIIFLAFLIPILTCNYLDAKTVSLVGAGATFPYPFYSKIFRIYHEQTNTKVNYQAIGSGGGIRQLMNKLVDFGATDAYVTDKFLKKFSSPIVHIPTVVGAVVISYNLPGNPKIKLTPKIISEIFMGKIRKWNDPQLQAINKDLKLPNIDIVVVHRSDGSGTTFIFSDYLASTSKEWAKKVGRGKSLNWPVGLGAKGNPGVAGLIKQIPGAVGYVELVYALSNNMAYAKIKNKSGNFINPTIESITAATNTTLPNDMRVSLVNTDSKNGYPICGFTWIIVYKDLSKGNLTLSKAKALVKLLWWITHQAQKYAEPLYYAPLSKKAQEKTENIIKSLSYKGENLWIQK